MAPALIIAGVGLGVAGVGSYMSYKSGKKQAKFQRQAIQAQRRQDNLRAARERREAVRAARIARGNVEQAAVNQGVQSSSMALGGLGSIDSQLSSNLSFLDQFNSLSDQASIALGKANKAGVAAQTWGQVADLGFKVANSSSGISGAVFGKGN